MTEDKRDNVVKMPDPNSNRVTTVADLAAFNDIEFQWVTVCNRQWCLKSLEAGGLIEWQEANEGEAKKTAGLRMIVSTVVDGIPGVDAGATGAQVFGFQHLEVWKHKSTKLTEGLVREILKMNGLNVRGEAIKNG